MRFLSFGRLFKNRAKSQNPKRKRKPSRRELLLERLEKRELLTAAPFIKAVIPADGSTVSGTPTQLQVTYSEPMVTSEITTKTNYLLFASDGTSVSIDAVALDGVTPNTVDISFNSGAPLVADTYTLFLEGDKVHDTADGLPVATPGELVVANGSTGTKASPATISFVNVAGDGTLGAVANYPNPVNNPAFPQPFTPMAVAFGDLSGDTVPGKVDAKGNPIPIPDLIVVGNDTVMIFKGQAGGGFLMDPSTQPNKIYSLPAGSGASSVVVGDFNNDGLPDFAVLDQKTNNVTMFINNRVAPGSLSFNELADVSAGAGTVVKGNLVAGDFNNDGNLDVAVADSAKHGTATNFAYDISILKNDGTGKLTTPTAADGSQFLVGGHRKFKVGTASTSYFFGIQKPSNLAVGQLNSDVRPDLVVTGDDGAVTDGGLVALLNTSSPAAFSFSYDFLNLFGANFSSAAIGDMNADGFGDVVASNTTAGMVEVYAGSATGPSSPPATSVKVTTPANDVTIQDFTGTGAPSILYVNTGQTTGGLLGVIPNLTISGSFALGTPTTYKVDGGGAVGLAVTPHVTSTDQITIDTNHPIGQDPTTGDTNQDTFADVVTANGNGNDVTLLLGNGDGTLRFSNDVPINPAIGKNPDPVATAVGDLNGDGLPDLVVADQKANTVSVFLSTGVTGLDSSGRPTYSYNSILLNPPTKTAVGGALPAGTYFYVVTATTSTGETGRSNEQSITTVGTTSTVTLTWTQFLGATGYNVYRGTSSGGEDTLIATIPSGSTTTFTDTGTEATSPATPPPPLKQDIAIPVPAGSQYTGLSASPVSVAIGDIDKDGHNDIIVANQGDNTVTILYGPFTFDATGQLQPASIQTISLGTTTTANPTGLVLGDFNNDGLLDLAVAHNGSLFGDTQRGVTVILNLGNRVYDIPHEYGSGTHAQAVVAADFFHNGNLDLALADAPQGQPGQVVVLKGQGDGSFTTFGKFATVSSPSALAVGDFNRDGLPDLVVTSNSTTPGAAGNLGVLLNNFGNGFAPSIPTSILNGAALQNVVVTDVNQDAYPDLVVSVQQELNPPPLSTARTSIDNLFVLKGNGDGTFGPPAPYFAGGRPNDLPEPSVVGLLSNSLVRVTTFTVQTNLVRTNLVRNGKFNKFDLTLEQGNLTGWQTFNQAGSFGLWSAEVGSQSPLSEAAVSVPPGSQYSGMLDQASLFPTDATFLMTHTEPSSDFAGSHAIYQTFVIPNTTTQLLLSLNLFLDNVQALNNGAWSDPGTTPRLDFNQGVNQQVRVDIIDANANAGSDGLMDVGNSVAQNIFITRKDVTPSLLPYTLLTADLTGLLSSLTVNQLGQKIIRLRIAATNNQGRLIVGVTGVKLVATYTDNAPPIITGLHLRNPGFGSSPAFGGNSTDPSLVGQVNDDGLSPADALTPALGSPNNIKKVIFDTANDGDFNGPDDFAINNWDPMGNFSITLTQLGDFLGQVPQLLPGTYTIGVQAIDKAGNTFTSQIQFTYQGPSTSAWAAQQGATNVQNSDPAINYPTVSGWVTSIVADPRDQAGNTYYAGSRNGGVWKTTDGGNDWTPVTSFVTDPLGNPVPTPIGAMALFVDPNPAPGAPKAIIYAGTGVADELPDARPGIGILKSIDNGSTWTVVGQSVFTGARISKMTVSTFTDPVTHVTTNYVYAAVASGGAFGPGVYRSTDAGVTWTNVLDPTKMTIAPSAGGGTVKSNGLLVSMNGQFLLPSVTDITIDPFNPEDVIIGIGNIGLSPVNDDKTGKFLGDAGGLWKSTDFGINWTQVVGNSQNFANDSIPHGFDKGPSTKLGRITLAEGSARVADEGFLYAVLTSSPQFDFLPGNPAPPVFVQGGIKAGTSFVENNNPVVTPLGLYKSRDLGDDWTHVGLTQGTSTVQNISLFGFRASLGGALVVDPLDPNVVYLGGRTGTAVADKSGTLPGHGLLRVDTRNIHDTAFPNTNSPSPNDGMDVTNSKIGAFWIDLGTHDTRDTTFVSGLPLNLPDQINALTFDAQGRLLIGTQQGIWRGINYGFSDGASPPDASAGAKGMTFTDLNGNLQIADLTSVALDPTNPNVLYTGSFYNGSALTGGIPGSLTFNALGGTTALASATGADQFATFVLTGPNSSPGTPTTIYRTWAFTPGSPTGPGLTVEVYIPGTGVWKPIIQGITNTTDQAGLFPPLAVSPLSSQELAYGTQRIYETDTASNQGTGTGLWDSGASLGSKLMTDTSKQGETIFFSALAFAPSAADVIYAGTEDGKVVTNLSGTFPTLPAPPPDSPLPNTLGFVAAPGFLLPRINGITVDPNNASVAYVMVGSTAGVTVAGKHAGHVWRTTNGGATWIDLSANLPDVPAYSMVIDPRYNKIYLGTEVGVYISTNGGASWSRLGLGLPFVPVVDLVFNQATETIAGATLGRGAFTISTNILGPAVVSLSPGTPLLPALTQTTVGFNEPVDPRSLSIVQDATARENIVDLIDHSTEFRTDLVNGWYATFLLRQPGPGEAAIWVNQLATGSTQEQVIATIVSSDEYFNNPSKGKGDTTDWLNSIYQDLVGRAPTSDEINQATMDFTAGATRAQVALADVLKRTPYQTALVTSFFIKYLKRIPGQEEINRYLHLILFGATTEQVLDKVIGSPEYYLKNGTTTLDGSIAPSPPSPPVTSPADLALQLQTQNSKPSAVALADVNGDGIADLIVANGVSDPASAFKDTISIFLGKPGGTFNPTPIVLALPTGAAPAALTVGDFNNDGKMDIAVANRGLPSSAAMNSVSVFINTSSGSSLTFTRSDFDGGNNPDSIVAADFNAATIGGKPILDLAVADGSPDSSGNNDVTLLMGTGTGTFGAPITLNTGLSSPGNGVAAGLLDSDNKPDLAVSSGAGVIVLLNDSTGIPGTFNNIQTAVTTPIVLTTLSTTSVAIGPIDANATPDVVATTPLNGGLVLLYQNSGGSSPTFTGPTSLNPAPASTPGAFAAGPTPTGVTIQDLNGDKRNDILVVNAVFPGTLTVLHNTTVSGTPPIQNAPTTSPAGGSLNANTYFYVVTALLPVTGETTAVNEESITTTGSSSTVSLSWSAVPGATGYKIYRGTSSGNENTLLTTITSAATTTFTDTGNELTSPGSPPLVSFTPFISYPVGNKPLGLALADVNQDGVLDVATANSSTNDISLLTGISDGSYQMPTDQSWINQSFVDLLQRPADANALSIFFPALEQQEVVRLVGPRGTTVPLSVTPDPTSNNQVFNLTFAPQVMDGTYTLVIAPNTRGLAGDVKDFENNAQNQNRNLLNGEIPADSFAGLLAINTSDDGRFVTGLYHDLLGRAADTPGFLFFLGPIDAVRAQELVAISTSYATSAENYGNFIRRIYSSADPGATGNYMLPISNLLLRQASPGEVNSWVQFLQGGGTEEQIIAAFVGSGEYFANPAKGNNSTDTWLNAAYMDILGRPAADAQALIFKNQLLTNNTTFFRTQIASFLMSSDEYRTRIIQAADLAFFGRVAGPGDLSSGLSILRLPSPGPGQPTRNAQFVIGILSSGEYFYRVGNSNASWVISLFTRLLGRPADLGGFNFWSAVLINSYQPQRLGAATLIDTSTEYRARLVTGYFLTYLHRPPSPGEVNQFVSFIQQGFTDEQIIAILLGSGEYLDRITALPHDNGAWLNSVYLQLLHRDRISDPGAGFFLNALNNGSLSRQTVASMILNSVEYKRDLIASFFNTYLQRNKAIPTPPDAEVDAWAAALIQGARDEQVIAQLLSSPEYFNLPHPFP